MSKKPYRKRMRKENLHFFYNFDQFSNVNKGIIDEFVDCFYDFYISQKSIHNKNIQLYTPKNEHVICKVVPLVERKTFRIQSDSANESQHFNDISKAMGFNGKAFEISRGDFKQLKELIISFYTGEFTDIEEKIVQDEMNEIENIIKNLKDSSVFDIDVIAKNRLFQSKFRDLLLVRYANKCAICNIDIKEMLIASHIKPYSKCEAYEKIDVNNGIILCANHDKLFDRFLLSFDNFKVRLSDKIQTINNLEVNCNDLGNNLTEDTRAKMQKYISYHFEQFKNNFN